MWPVVSRWETAVDPFADLHRLNREMGRLFDGSSTYPALDIWGNENEVRMVADLPGIDPAKIQLTVNEGVLTLEGERPQQAVEEKDVVYRNERLGGSFRRSVQLPFEVEQDHIQARYENGTLMVTLPKAEKAKPRQITIAIQ